MASDQQKQRRREYMREYMRDRRARERAARADAGEVSPTLSVVPAPNPTPADLAAARRAHQVAQQAKADADAEPRSAPVGVVESGVRRELEALKFDESRPGVFQTALALARVLDNRGAVTQHPSAGGRLAEILDRANGGKAKGKSKLAAMREAN